MKLTIDTTDSDNVKVQCEKFDPYELGLVLGTYIAYMAGQADADAEYLKKEAARSISTALLNSASEAEIKDVRPWERGNAHRTD